MDKKPTMPVDAKDYFTKQGNFEYAGKHILLDVWGASNLDDPIFLEAVLRESVVVCGATLLHIHIHQFTPTGGLSGTAILAESHINVHTWPERDFAAFDVFMCGNAEPEKIETVIEKAFRPEKIISELRYRGDVRNNSIATGT